MKYPILFLALTVVLLTGCTRRYTVTLQNGHQMTSFGKPKLENNVYTFKDGSGETRYVSAPRIREIAPASMAGSPFKPGK